MLLYLSVTNKIFRIYKLSFVFCVWPSMNLICGSVRSNKKNWVSAVQRFMRLLDANGQTSRDVNVSIFKQKLSFCYEKKENETKRSFFKMIVFIQLVIVSVTIVVTTTLPYWSLTKRKVERTPPMKGTGTSHWAVLKKI